MQHHNMVKLSMHTTGDRLKQKMRSHSPSKSDQRESYDTFRSTFPVIALWAILIRFTASPTHKQPTITRSFMILTAELFLKERSFG